MSHETAPTSGAPLSVEPLYVVLGHAHETNRFIAERGLPAHDVIPEALAVGRMRCQGRPIVPVYTHVEAHKSIGWWERMQIISFAKFVCRSNGFEFRTESFS